MLNFKPRIEDRTRALLGARMRAGGGEREVAVVDVSTRGLLLAAKHPPRRGEYVDLVIGGHDIVCQVKWSGPSRFGVALRDRISVIGLLSGDTGQITIKAREAQGRHAARNRRGYAHLGRIVQFAGALAALAGAAWTLADYVGHGLGSVREARDAMALTDR